MGTTDSRGIYTPVLNEVGWDTQLASNFGLFATGSDITAAVGAALASIASFSKTAAWQNSAGLTTSTIVAWTAPFACTVTGIKGYRVGGSGATVNAYKGTTATALRSANLSLTSTDTWMDGGAVQNTGFAIGNSLLLALASVSGAPTQVSLQVNFTRT